MKFLQLSVLATTLLVSASGLAEERTAEPAVAAPGFHADAETDPTAFILSGYSLHVGLGYRRFRLDLGTYAIDVPRFVHGNSDFDASFDGFGAKVQFFPFAEQKGPFVGVDGGVSRFLLERRGYEDAARRTQFVLGAHAGWRISLPAGFYATPWLGVSYAVNTADVTLRNATFRPSPITVFPAVHIGYRFQ